MDDRASSEQRAGTGEPVPATDAEPEVVDAEVVDEGEQAASEVEIDLDALLAERTRERDEHLELAQRARADFENYRRRVKAEIAEAEQRGRASLARGVLPALDNLERALVAAGVDPAQHEAIATGQADGVENGTVLETLERGYRVDSQVIRPARVVVSG